MYVGSVRIELWPCGGNDATAVSDYEYGDHLVPMPTARLEEKAPMWLTCANEQDIDYSKRKTRVE